MIEPKMFLADFIFRQQENQVDNQKCQAGFRPLCNKVPKYLHIQLDLILTQLFQDAPNPTSSETNLEDDKTNEATDVIEDVSKSAFENMDEDTQTPIKRQKTVSFSENVEQEIEEATEGKSSLKSALQLLDEIDDEKGKCYIPSKSALQLLAEIL